MTVDAAGDGWVEDSALDAFRLSAVNAVPMAAVREALCSRPESATQATFEEAFNGLPAPSYGLVDEVGGCVLVARHNGWQGSEENALCRASHGERMVSYNRSVKADTLCSLAEDGALVSAFDAPLEGAVP